MYDDAELGMDCIDAFVSAAFGRFLVLWSRDDI